MIDMSVSGLVGIRNGSPSPISWVWGRPTTAPKPTPSRCYHQNHNPNLPTLVGMIRVQRSGGEYHPDPFPPLVGMNRSSGEAVSTRPLFSPPRWGSAHEDTKGEGTHQWVPSPVLCEGYRVTDPG